MTAFFVAKDQTRCRVSSPFGADRCRPRPRVGRVAIAEPTVGSATS